MMPYKRPAADKSGMPVYQPSATTYQQLMQLQQQPFVPVSCEYTSPPPNPTSTATLHTTLQQQAQATSCASPVTTAVAQPAVTTVSLPSNEPKAPPAPILIQSQQPQTQTIANNHIANHIQSTQQQELTNSEHVECQALAIAASTAPPLPPQTVTPALDAAALAKEVAQQNYAKAVKLAAVSQSYGINNALSALSYTGVALNKQPVTAIPPPALPRYSTIPFAFTGASPAATSALGLGLASPYAHQAAITQPNILAFTRPPPTVINPYSLLRPYATAPTAAAAPTILGHPQSHLLAAAQYQTIAPQVAIPQTPVPVSVSMPQTNNNNVVLNPYKKMKTT